MARNDKRYSKRKRVCRFCTEPIRLDYKDVNTLSRFITERKKIAPKRSSGLCAFHQRKLASTIKRARFMALLPYTVLH